MALTEIIVLEITSIFLPTINFLSLLCPSNCSIYDGTHIEFNLYFEIIIFTN